MPALTEFYVNNAMLLAISFTAMALIAYLILFFQKKEKRWANVILSISLILNFTFMFGAFIAMSLPYIREVTYIGG